MLTYQLIFLNSAIESFNFLFKFTKVFRLGLLSSSLNSTNYFR